MHVIEALDIARLEPLFARVPLFFFVLDADLRFMSLTGASLDTLGVDPTLFIGSPALGLFERGDDPNEAWAAFARASAGKEASFVFIYHRSRFIIALEPVLRGRKVEAIIGVGTDRRGAGRPSARLHDVHSAMLQAESEANFAYYTVELETEAAEITPGFARIFGFPEDVRRLHYGEIVARVHPEDRLRYTRQRARSMSSGTQATLDNRIVRPSGEMRYVRAFLSYFSGEHGAPVRSVGVVFDETERYEDRRDVEFLSQHDPLTGLLNRTGFEARVHEGAVRAQAHETGVALLIFDIDGFSEINDIAGYATGDQLLRSVADRVRALERDGAIAARIGGDEFAILVPNLRSVREAEEWSVRVRNVLRAPAHAEGSYALTASIGAVLLLHVERNAPLVARAHMALLAAKAGARGMLRWYTPDLERSITARHRLETELSLALPSDQFVLHYQPIVESGTGSIVAVEALLRWAHPELGLVSPDDFLPAAEQTGRMLAIGDWVMERAAREVATISEALGRPIRVNVNVAPAQLQVHGFVERALQIVERAGIAAEQMQIEVTEQSLIVDVEHAADVLSELRESGFSVAIDDFGTGYNTLSYLKSYPVTYLKIDRTFVRDLESDDYSRAICSSVATLAQSLGLRLIGEGVETAAQDRFLRELGCDELQGFFYGRPVGADEIA